VPHEIIRSKDNAALRRARAVGAGREEGLLLEGERLLRDAIASGQQLEFVLVSAEHSELGDEWSAAGLDVRVAATGLLEGSSRLRSAPGCMAVCATPRTLSPQELAARDGMLLAIAGVADPGNLGALARTAEAAGVAGLAIVAGGCSPWNEKALRGSMGSLLRLPVGLASVDEFNAAFARAGRRPVRAATRGGAPHTEYAWSARSVLWLAAETGALPEGAELFEAVSIAMAGPSESLNVAAAGAVLLFEAARQLRSRASGASQRAPHAESAVASPAAPSKTRPGVAPS
jgi:TrmH family RNA methyltransferase